MRERRLILSEELDEAGIYKLLTGTVVPRPIAWVSTLDVQMRPNLAPFSFFNAASIVPPIVVIAIEPRGKGKKDTLRNIENNGEFVVNVVAEGLTHAVVTSAIDFPAEESEFEQAELTLAPSKLVRPPRVAESPVGMECRLNRLITLGSGPHTLVVGEVLAWQVDPEVLDGRGRVDFSVLRPVGRMAGDEYVRCTDLLAEARRDWRGESYQ
jgi:flavin reductase (DIM6/NTAB) family NADH-FMN oxidoreductase RutF